MKASLVLAAMLLASTAGAARAGYVEPSYRELVSAWLEIHKRYPDTALQRGEEGRAVLRFAVDRSGRVLSYTIAQSTGYADLDASVGEMMRGAVLPPFPASMTQPRIDVSVTIRFSRSDGRYVEGSRNAPGAATPPPAAAYPTPPSVSVQPRALYLQAYAEVNAAMDRCLYDPAIRTAIDPGDPIEGPKSLPTSACVTQTTC
jgi:TonB family protein